MSWSGQSPSYGTRFDRFKSNPKVPTQVRTLTHRFDVARHDNSKIKAHWQRTFFSEENKESNESSAQQ